MGKFKGTKYVAEVPAWVFWGVLCLLSLVTFIDVVLLPDVVVPFGVQVVFVVSASITAMGSFFFALTGIVLAIEKDLVSFKLPWLRLRTKADELKDVQMLRHRLNEQTVQLPDDNAIKNTLESRLHQLDRKAEQLQIEMVYEEAKKLDKRAGKLVR